MRRNLRGVEGVRARAPEWQKAKKLGSREAYFRPEGEHEGPLVLVHHIQKTTGTSFRAFVRANLNLLSAEVEILPNEITKREDRARLIRWYGDWYRRLEPARRARLCCLMSNTAGFLLPSLDRPAETLVLVREPLERVMSFHYDFKQRRPEDPDEPLAALEEKYAHGGDQVLRSRRDWEYVNGQSRHLLSVFHDVSEFTVSAGPPADADVWRERLRELVERVFLVGVQEWLDDYVGEVAARYGWTPFVPHDKVNPERPPRADVSAGLRETILAYNWLDSELHELARAAQERRRAESGGRR